MTNFNTIDITCLKKVWIFIAKKRHDSIFPQSRINVIHLNSQNQLHYKYFNGGILVNKNTLIIRVHLN